MISVENISYKYPKREKAIISGLSCAFEMGEIVAVTGKNGCGKTTLTKLIAGMLRPDSGRIMIDGRDNREMDLFDIGCHVGYVFQDPSRQLFCQSVYDEIAYALKNMGRDEKETEKLVEHYMDFFRLTHHRNDYPGKLSQGEKQRTMLAAVLAMGTDYVILDEPTSGLDIKGREELGTLLQSVRDSGKGIIIVSHERAFIERYTDRELVMG